MADASSELPEFLETVTQAPSPAAAVRAAVIALAETFDAEVAALVHDGRVMATTGFGRDAAPVDQLLALAEETSTLIDVPGSGPTEAVTVALGDRRCVMVIGRCGGPLDASERAHAQAMLRILTLSMRLLDQISENQVLLEEQRGNQAVLEAILRVQRLISQRRPVDDVLHSITEEAADLVGADLAGISLVGADGVEQRALTTIDGDTQLEADVLSKRQLADIERRAMNLELLVPSRVALTTFGGGMLDIIATGAPVFEGGETIGALYVLSDARTSRAGELDTAAVQTFASQASIALTDAHTLDELHHAFHDTLTGLPNRALFKDRFEHALKLGYRRGTRTALLFLDLDRFKTINDTLGHAAGDKLLREVGDRLRSAGRAHDSVARIGGDEFAILLEDSSPEEAEATARRLLDLIGEVASPSSALGVCTASIGVAVTGPDCNTTDELLRRADIAMYTVKAEGRAGVAVYDASMGRSRLDQNAMTDAMQVALVRDDFLVVYQPILSLWNRQISGVEALVRWHDPTMGVLNPADFISIAEDTGMIVPIGRRVMDVACQQVAAWRETLPGTESLSVSVNLSGRQLEYDGLEADIVGVLDSAGLEPSALTLEVTESIFVDDAQSAGDRLRSLKKLGVKLAIDDFGTGYSSLAYVQNYDFDVLKIDRSFVTGLGSAGNDGAVIKTMLSLAEQLGMATVAEGIESPIELAQLRALRCSHGQGYLFSMPVDAESMGQLLSEQARTLAGT